MECQVTVNHAAGLHARPTAEFVKAAIRYKSKIEVLVDTQTANAKSILSLLALGIKQGQSMVLRAEGPDAKEALSELSSLLEGM